MEALEVAVIPAGALLLVDSAPIIYTLEAHPRFARRFAPLSEPHAAGEIALAVTTVTIAEVLTGPLDKGRQTLAARYRTVLASWQVVALDLDVAERAARLRAAHRLKLPDAIQLASALAINAYALVTHDRDFSPVRGMRILA